LKTELQVHTHITVERVDLVLPDRLIPVMMISNAQQTFLPYPSLINLELTALTQFVMEALNSVISLTHLICFPQTYQKNIFELCGIQ
jgi:hypothetical protein